MVKNLPANAGNIRDSGSISGLGRSLDEGMAIHSNILAWRIPWTKETGGLFVKFILYIYLDILFLKSCVFDNSLKLVTY